MEEHYSSSIFITGSDVHASFRIYYTLFSIYAICVYVEILRHFVIECLTNNSTFLVCKIEPGLRGAVLKASYP